jgi:hypothetical protein
MVWPIYVYLVATVLVAGSAAIKVGWAPGLYAALVGILSFIAGGGLKASVLWGSRAQKIGGTFVAGLIVVLAQWLSSGFSVRLFHYQLDGSMWGWIGFGVGLIFTSRDLAAAGRVSAQSASKTPVGLLGALGELMERYPTALLDSSRLPAPKQVLKTVIKNAWKREPSLRNQLECAYVHLSHFQDGIGDAVLDCNLPDVERGPDAAPDLQALQQQAIDMAGHKGENFRQWAMWSKVSLSEMEILLQEWQAFENGPAHLQSHRNLDTDV